MCRSSTSPFILATAGLAAVLATAPARGAEALDKELAVVAQRVQKFLKAENQTTIAVGEFSGPAQLDTNFGPGVADVLARELQARGVSVSRTASLSVRGRYDRVASDWYPGQTMIRLTVEVYDCANKPRGSFQFKFYDTATIAAFLGVTASLPPDGGLRSRNLQVVDAAVKPLAVVNGARVRASDDSPFAVELLVHPGPGRPPVPCTPVLTNGQAVVEIKRGESYTIRLHNQARFDAAAIITIDGLNVFTFSDVRGATGAPLYSFYPVAAGSTLDVPGWFRTLGRSDTFLVTAYGHGASAVQCGPQPGKTGVLTVAFSACAPTADGLPSDERMDARGGEQNETGLGPPQKTQFVQVNRVLGVLRDVVSIRYTH
jgi:hypothetical protein